ncbi:hypothetical protein J7T55_006047 [Diaporthe amygdali]|uniref:uncharacterized protein n=1 Tax=Phomopsis amygdali TaxID=1214568 RepID=UPI0022FEC19B|nr:uncharacterized protein J7T55_006047 [Diaporthe amygdali]KAJ0124706.1 hypothetical protein J7T55_006047 [Diaporthe amygdali]
MAPTVPPVASISSDSKPAVDHELHLTDLPDAVALYGLFLTTTLFLMLLVTGLCFMVLGWATTIGGVISLGLLIVTRHFYITRMRSVVNIGAETTSKHGLDLSHLPAVSYLYVFGSGGHTTEMTALIKLSFKAKRNQHRRYIITDDDQHSQNQEMALERLLHQSCADEATGTYDTIIVPRARKVYQSYSSSVYTSLRCALDILVALTTIPAQRAGTPNASEFRHPHVVVTNGPGTGFIVGLMAHMLKVLYLAPEDRLKVVFVETWARTHNLGLTGKLFYWTGIPDVFVVQSEKLSKILGKPNIGNVNMRLKADGITNSTNRQ